MLASGEPPPFNSATLSVTGLRVRRLGRDKELHGIPFWRRALLTDLRLSILPHQQVWRFHFSRFLHLLTLLFLD
jgi:hypothetical protein